MSLSVSFKTLGKYLDQPALIKYLSNATPVALSALGAAYVLKDSDKAPKTEQKNRLIQKASVMTFTIGSAILATKGFKIGKKTFEGLIETPHMHKDELNEVFVKIKDKTIKALVEKVKKEEILGIKQVKTLMSGLKNEFNDEKIISKIIPDAHTHDSPFGELKKLSLLGLMPVLGGITGGLVGDVLTKENWKKKFPDKIKEGSYQYLNNIFLCNVGAGIAMLTMNKLNIQNKAARFTAMLAGVVGVGLFAGSAIANYIGKKIINPIFKTNKDEKPITFKNLNSERHPEALDLSLHIDDIASVGFLSGFKWIGPILPILYSVSGYRAGIGYRNGDSGKH